MDQLLAFLGSGQNASPEALAAFLDSEIAPFFDFEHMAKTAGGRLYERLEDAERQAIVARIKQSFLSKMADKLGNYDQQQVRFMPPRGGNNARARRRSVSRS